MIEVENISYDYEGSQGPALDNVSLSIEKGEFIGIVGHNGSGKSTLAKHLNALFLPTKGRVMIDGMDTCDETKTLSIRQKVGMIFQNPDNQLVTTVVEEDVAFGPENLGIEPSDIRKRVDAALMAVDMSAYKKRAPHMLSGGQKQRIAIAGMLAMEPDVLVMDEATAMLDPMGRREIIATVRKLNREAGMTIVMITQHMEEVVHCDRVIAMSGGKMLYEGRPEEVFKKMDELREIGLDVPAVVALNASLEPDSEHNPITIEDMADSLAKILAVNKEKN